MKLYTTESTNNEQRTNKSIYKCRLYTSFKIRIPHTSLQSFKFPSISISLKNMSWTLEKSAPPYSPPVAMYAQPTGYPMQQSTAMMPTMVSVPQQYHTMAQPQVQQQQVAAQPALHAAIEAQMVANQMNSLFGKKECEHSFKTEVSRKTIFAKLL